MASCLPALPACVQHRLLQVAYGPAPAPRTPPQQEVPYTKPVVLRGVEAVLARCGAKELLLTRVAQRTQRASPNPPLAPPRGAAAPAGKEGKAAGKEGRPERLNVLLLFIDSLGRRHFFRRMPATAAALEALARGGGSTLHQFFRYNVVGFHTDPNTCVRGVGWRHRVPARAAVRRDAMQPWPTPSARHHLPAPTHTSHRHAMYTGAPHSHQSGECVWRLRA